MIHKINGKIKKIFNDFFIMLIYFLKLKRYVRKEDFTILSNNCVGGVLYHRMRREFTSPFINLYLGLEDYLYFLLNFYEIINIPIKQNIEETKRIKFPVGTITYKNRDINIYFMHYANFDDAIKKWLSRTKKIKYNNIYIILDLCNILDTNYIKKILNKFELLKFQNKIALTRFDLNYRTNKKIIFKFKEFKFGQIVKNETLFKKPIDQLILSGFFKH